MKRTINTTTRGAERTSNELRATNVNGRLEQLPDDPAQVAAILRARKSPAQRAKARLAAEAKRRGI